MEICDNVICKDIFVVHMYCHYVNSVGHKYEQSSISAISELCLLVHTSRN